MKTFGGTAPRSIRMERGSALVVVLGTMIVLILIATVGLTFAMQTNKFARHVNDDSGAYLAAQAGVEDYNARLNANNDYWKTVDCSNPALQGPNNLQGSNNLQGLSCGYNPTTPVGYLTAPYGVNSDGRAQFHQDIDTSQAAIYGNITITSTGKVGNSTRTVRSLLHKAGLAQYVLLADYGTVDPGDEVTYGLNNTAVAKYCPHYFYDKYTTPASSIMPRAISTPLFRTNTSTDAPVCQDFGFNTGANFFGPVHQNDAVETFNNPNFQGPVTTSWLECLNGTPSPSGGPNSAPGGASCYDPTVAQQTNNPIFHYGISYHKPIGIPTSISDLRPHVDATRTTNPGCLYTGPTRIKFNENAGNATGTMTVWSNFSKTPLNPGCGNSALPWPQTLPIPNNNLIIVQDVPAVQPFPVGAKCLPGSIGDGIPLANDDNQNLANANCRLGTVFVEGTVNGRLTVAADNDVVITGDLLYAGKEQGTDALGLVATNSTYIYHPVNTTTNQNLPLSSGKLQRDPQVYAALASLNHGFGVLHYDTGKPLGTINLYGSSVERFKLLDQVVSKSGSGVSGYDQRYRYDTRLADNPPPFFPTQVGAEWGTQTLVEVPPLYN